MARTLQAPVTVAFDYTRSTGPVLGRFLTGLRDGTVLGGRTSDGKLLAGRDAGPLSASAASAEARTGSSVVTPAAAA